MTYNTIKYLQMLGLVVLLLLSPGTTAYTVERLQRLAQAASLSYLPMEKMGTSPYLEASQLTPLGQVVDPITESGATVFADHPNGQLIVACRGSANPRNFGTNFLKFKAVRANRLSQTIPPPADAMVHEGFQDASVGLWQKLGPPLLETLRRQPFDEKITSVVFTGHSLGAATALLCAVHYSACQNDPHLEGAYLSPTIVTFGGPQLCNGSLARFLRNGPLEGCDILHLVHSQDPVLVNNQRVWKQMGFENVGIEMQCDPKTPTVYCDENDEQCATTDYSDGTTGTSTGTGGGGPPPSPPRPRLGVNVAWNILNHCNYMGVFIGPRMMGVGPSAPSTPFSPTGGNGGMGASGARSTIRSDQDRFRV